MSDPTLTRLPACSCPAAAAPLALINEYKTQADNYAEWQKWGEEILVRVFGGLSCAACWPAHVQQKGVKPERRMLSARCDHQGGILNHQAALY